MYTYSYIYIYWICHDTIWRRKTSLNRIWLMRASSNEWIMCASYKLSRRESLVPRITWEMHVRTEAHTSPSEQIQGMRAGAYGTQNTKQAVGNHSCLESYGMRAGTHRTQNMIPAVGNHSCLKSHGMRRGAHEHRIRNQPSGIVDLMCPCGFAAKGAPLGGWWRRS